MLLPIFILPSYAREGSVASVECLMSFNTVSEH